MNEQLQQLISEINQLSVQITESDLLSKKHSKISLDLACRTGDRLAKSKEMISENWEGWFNEHIRGFTVRTAYNWISLHEIRVKHGSVIFDDCNGIRQALRKARELNKPEPFIEISGGANTQPRGERIESWSLEREVKTPVNRIMKLLKQYHVEDSKYLELLKPIVKYYNKRKPPVKKDSFDLLNELGVKLLKQKRKQIMDDARRVLKLIPVEKSKPVRPPKETVATE